MRLCLTQILMVIVLSACAYSQKQIDEDASLYERLGQRKGIERVVQDMTRYVSQDERINGFFVGANIERLNRILTDQICQVTGGPCVYEGQDMLSVHTGMNITEDQFNALVEDLIKSMNQHGVRQREQRELLTLLGSMKKDIVDR